MLQLKLFLAAAEYNSFSEASFESYISQSAFSKQIKKLENEFGVLLFDRNSSKISLTPAGRLFLPYAEKLISLYDEMTDVLQDYSHGGNISIGSLPLMQEYGISEAICRFQEYMTNAEVNIMEFDQPNLLKALNAQQIDFAVLRTDRIDAAKYDVLPLISDSFVFAASPKYASVLSRCTGSGMKMEDIPFIILGKDSDVYKMCLDLLSNLNYHPQKLLTTSRHLHLLNMVNTNCGVGILPRKMINFQQYPDIQIISPPITAETSIGLVKLKNAEFSPMVKRLYDFMEDSLCS